MIKNNPKLRKRYISFLIAIIILVPIIIFATNSKLKIVNYKIESHKVNENIRIALLTDLHSCSYGKGQTDLLNAVYEQNPDIVLLGGDIADDVLPEQNAITLLEGLSKKYPCYYVSGNHEYRKGEIYQIKEMFRSTGVTVLEGESMNVYINKQKINLCGIDDAYIGKQAFSSQVSSVSGASNSSLFTVLLAHRPEYIDTYREYNFDLILSGHAHGGQWRLPGLINGLLAPNQGFFPKYAGGKYDFDNTTLIVSRGLAKESTRVPRVFNRPELVIVDIE